MTQQYEDARWQAVLRRDPAADFLYGVRSTGIYCRPSCPSRRPKPDNALYFGDPAAAERAGYRACRRCQPNAVSDQTQLVARVKHLLDTQEPAPGLTELGAAVGLSPSHLQRVFKRAVGVSPKQYAVQARAERFKTGLRRGASVTEAVYDAGYGSSRAAYDRRTDALGMSPGAYARGGAGQAIGYVLTDSPLGRMLVAATERGLCAVRFGEDAPLLAELRAEYWGAVLTEDAAGLAERVGAVLAHLNGRPTRLDWPTDAPGSAFQQRVWAAIRSIPPSQTRTYAQLAEMIGQPSAVRAVASACAANPVALLVPCHRVVRTGGGLGGYRWGLERKRALLKQERVSAAD